MKDELLNKKASEQNQMQENLIKNKSSLPIQFEIIEQGEEQEMKFRGITIHKHKMCSTWYARYRANGKQHYISARTQQECYNKLKVALKKLEQKQLKLLKEPKQKEQKVYTLHEWYDLWLNTYKVGKIKDTTLMDYKSSLKYFENLFKIRLNELTNLNITQTLNKIPYARRKQKVYEILNDMLNKAVKNNLIKNNPITDERPKHKRVNGISLSMEDEKLLEQVCRDKYKIFLVCLYQGLRKGEVLALTKKDFNFNERTLTINKSLNILNKTDTTKNDTSNRVMPLFENTIQLLKKELEEIEDEERVFNYSQAKTGKMFVELKNLYKLNEKYTIHSLRHSFITRCQEKKIPLHIIQKWVGHTIGSKVTSNVYTHFRSEAEQEYLKIMEEN